MQTKVHYNWQQSIFCCCFTHLELFSTTRYLRLWKVSTEETEDTFVKPLFLVLISQLKLCF